MTVRNYEIELFGSVYGIEVDVEVHNGDVIRMLVDESDAIPLDRLDAAMAELERLVDLDRHEIERDCEEAAYDRSIDDRISARKEGF